MFSVPLGRLLTASIIASLVGIGSFVIGPNLTTQKTSMELVPNKGILVVDELIVVEVLVTSDIPVNVFQGYLSFDPDILTIDSINYNTSIADLWTERPWYSNGEGTLNFIGGTTKPGGFTGTDTIITITFKAKQSGEAKIHFDEIRIMQHDGLGTDATIDNPIDALFVIEEEKLQQNTIVSTSDTGPTLLVLLSEPNTDLNNDGKQNILDVSIFMSDLATQNMRSDFNGDAVVNLKDLSILNN